MIIHCNSVVVFGVLFFSGLPRTIPILSCGYWKVCLLIMITQGHMSASCRVFFPATVSDSLCLHSFVKPADVSIQSYLVSVSLWQDAMRFCQHTQEGRITSSCQFMHRLVHMVQAGGGSNLAAAVRYAWRLGERC